LAQVNRELEQAQAELNRIKPPNWCCCAGAFCLAPVIGGIFWYFVDIKPKQDKRRQLEQRVRDLEWQRNNLQTQLLLLNQ